LGFIRLLWRHQVSELAYRLLGGIAEYLLSRPAPQKNAALRIGTDNRDRRGIDDGCQGLLRAGTLDGFGGGGFTRLVKLLVASLEGRRHRIERTGQCTDFVFAANSPPVSQL